MDTQHGTWGVRTRTFATESCLVTILRLKANKRCSWHKHKHTYNQFFVIEGRLGIKTDIGPDKQRQTTIIGAGQSFVVAPGVMHEFQTYKQPALVEEVAYVKYDESDIHRMQLGGNIKDAINE